MIRPDSYSQSEGPSADHQFGSYKDETAVGANDGTGLFKDELMDLFQPWANLFTKHSITPSNVKEKQSVSQVTEALDAELTLTAGNVDTMNSNGTYTVEFDNKNGILILENPLTIVTLAGGAGIDDGSRLTVLNNTGGTVTLNPGGISLLDTERMLLFYESDSSAFVSLLGKNVIFGSLRNLSVIESTSKDSGSVILEGGIGIEKNTHSGGTIKSDSTNESTNKDSGAIVAVNGGIGAEKSINAGLDITGKNGKMILTNPIPYLTVQQGSDLNIATMGTIAIAALSSTRIAFIDSTNKDLRVYEFNGTIWAQVGNDLNIAVVGPTLAITALSSTRIAFIDDTNDDLRVYEFTDPNWAQVGNDLNIGGVIAPALAALSNTKVAFIDHSNDDLRVYEFTDPNWAQVGNDLNISGVEFPSIAALSGTRIAFIDNINEDLRTYEFTDPNWAQVGNDLNISGIDKPSIAAFSDNIVIFSDVTNDELRAYFFDGTDWAQVGNILPITGIVTNVSLAALNANRIAFLDQGNADLRTYLMNWSFVKTHFELF